MDEEGAGPAGRPEPREQLDRRDPGAGQRVGVHAPDRRDVGARGGVGDHPVPGELVALQAVLAPALAVALAGERAVARADPAHEPEGEGEVDGRADAVGALGRLLHPAAGQHVGTTPTVHRRGRGQQPRDRPQRVGGDAAHGLGPLGPPARHRGPHGVPAGRPRGEVRLVTQALVDEDVGEREQHDEVGPGHRGEVDPRAVLGELRRGRETGVDEHQPSPRPGAGEVLDERRHRGCGVRAHDEDGVGSPEVGEREGEPPVDPERAVGARCRRRHAEPAVVVDERRAQDDARELPERVGLLVGQAPTAEHRDGPAPGLLLEADEPAVDEVERLVPRGRLERGAPTAATHERRREAVGGPQDLRRAPALLAHPAPVRGEVARVDAHREHGVRDRRQRLGALERAVGAVRRRRHVAQTLAIVAPRRR